jgi:hypothetical protein
MPPIYQDRLLLQDRLISRVSTNSYILLNFLNKEQSSRRAQTGLSFHSIVIPSEWGYAAIYTDTKDPAICFHSIVIPSEWGSR